MKLNRSIGTRREVLNLDNAIVDDVHAPSTKDGKIGWDETGKTG
jgi:hypothetical protein